MANGDGQRAPIGEIFTRDFIILATINLSMFFGFQMLNVGLPVYMGQLGATAQLVGLATTLMTVTATLMRVFAGALLDRFGRMGMLIGGMGVMVCSIVSFAIFPVVGIILGLRLIHGIGWGLGSTSSSTIAADIIPKRRFAEGMGYFSMTTAIASAVAPAASIALVQGVGAVYMIYVSSGITLLALLLSVAEAALGKRREKNPAALEPEAARDSAQTLASESRRAHTDARAGMPFDTAAPLPAQEAPQPPIGARAGASECAPAELPLDESYQFPTETSPREPAGMPSHSPELARTQPERPYSKLETLFERRALLPGALIMLVNIGFGCITTFIALHADSQGADGVSAYFLVYAAVTLLSRPLIGKLIDRYGYRVPAILSTICTAGTLVVIGLADSMAWFAAAGVLGGLGIGTAMGTYQSMAVASVEPWRRGVATSTYMTAFDLGIAIGSLAGGLVADLAGYTVMYFVVAAFPLIASILSALAIKPRQSV